MTKTKRCVYADDVYNCHRPTPSCQFSYDCFGDVTEGRVSALRKDAERAFDQLKKARAEFQTCAKLLGRMEERLTNKLTQAHLIDVPSSWWKFWRPL